MPAATLTSKGRITIPREVRTSLGLGVGDRLDFVRLEDGNYAIVPASHSIRSLKGVLRQSAQPVSLEDMQAALEEEARGA